MEVALIAGKRVICKWFLFLKESLWKNTIRIEFYLARFLILHIDIKQK